MQQHVSREISGKISDGIPSVHQDILGTSKESEKLGETDEQIIGRVYEMTQQEFSGDFTKMHVILRFKVTETVGQDALTTFVGHSHQSDHTRRQIRRYRGKIDDVVDVVTTDGFLIRMKPLIITERRCQTSVKRAIRSKPQNNSWFCIKIKLFKGSRHNVEW